MFLELIICMAILVRSISPITGVTASAIFACDPPEILSLLGWCSTGVTASAIFARDHPEILSFLGWCIPDFIVAHLIYCGCSPNVNLATATRYFVGEFGALIRNEVLILLMQEILY